MLPVVTNFIYDVRQERLLVFYCPKGGKGGFRSRIKLGLAFLMVMYFTFKSKYADRKSVV